MTESELRDHEKVAELLKELIRYETSNARLFMQSTVLAGAGFSSPAALLAALLAHLDGRLDAEYARRWRAAPKEAGP